MDEKIKSLSLSKMKITEVDGESKERRVTFVASSSNEDRDYETVDIGSFRLPLKGGGEVLVRDLGASGSENVDVPLLTDHNHWEVDKVIGSVRRASYQDGKLIFEAGISGRDYAQEMFKLIEEGHLDNAFSISFRDYDYNPDTNKISNGEVIEVSLVTRGSNKDAHVLDVKALKGEKTVDKDATPAENPAETPAVDNTADNTNADAPAEKPADEGNNTEEAPKEEGEASEEKSVEANDNKDKSMHDLPNHTEMIASMAKMPSQSDPRTNSLTNSDYLKSKQADHDFARTIVDNYGKSSAAIMKAWQAHVREKGITGDAILPTSIEQIFFKAWEDHYEALGTFRRTTRLNGATYAFNTTDRALGNRKGDKKAGQNVTDVRRDYKAKIMYKKLPIDLQDLIDDETGELLRFRTEELSTRMGDELVRAVIFGDGRSEPTGEGPDYRIFDGTRGPWSMVGDLNEAAKTTGANAYSTAVASVIANSTTDSLWQKIIKVKGAIRGGEGRKIIFVPDGTLTELEVTTKDNGEPLFPLGTNMQEIFGTYIFESPYMAGSGYDVIGYREGSYLLAMGDNMVRTMFDLNYNQDVMLQERAVAGTIYGNKTLAGYASKA